MATEPDNTAWVWEGRVPRGFLTVLEGGHRRGKTPLVLLLAKIVATGDALSGIASTSRDEDTIERAFVFTHMETPLAHEWADHVHPLRNAGGLHINETRGQGATTSDGFELTPEGLATLEGTLQIYAAAGSYPALVAVDSVDDFAPASVSPDQLARALASLASKYDCAVLASQSPSKRRLHQAMRDAAASVLTLQQGSHPQQHVLVHEFLRPDLGSPAERFDFTLMPLPNRD